MFRKTPRSVDEPLADAYFGGVGTFDVLGIPVAATNLERAAEQLVAWSDDEQGRVVTVPDVSNIVRAQDDGALLAVHRGAAMVVPDGTPLVWIGKLRGHSVGRTCGPDLMQKVLSQSKETGLRSFLYGGKAGVAERLKDVFEAQYPGAKIVGASTPPFQPLTPDELNEIAAEIRAAQADLVWIGISTPKQEYLMARLAPLVPCTLLGVGAAFDFHTGEVKRAPRWMQVSGLEWLFRLLSEPKRLWRRYILMAPRFVGLVFLDSIGFRVTK